VEDRAIAVLSSFFGGLALLLASIGLYGLISYSVSRRTREIGVRAALGAQRTTVIWLVLREALALVLLGVLSKYLNALRKEWVTGAAGP
jgi:ABC-type antimicrobial peptide transport system permease subunit